MLDCCLLWKVYMAKSIPLRATLRVQRVAVVVGDIRREGFDRMLECLPAEGRLLGYIERKAVHSMSKASKDPNLR